IAGADDSALRNGSRLVRFRCTGIAAFGTVKAVNPSILMLSKSDIIHIGIRGFELRDTYRILAEPEMINTIGTFCNAKEGFPVGCFYADHQQVFILPFDGSGIEC